MPARHVGAAVGLALVGVVLAVGVGHARAQEPEASAQRDALVQRVQQTTDRIAAEESQVSALQAAVAADEAAALALGTPTTSERTGLEAEAGLVAVTGPGARVVLDDGAPQPDQSGVDPARVQDRDLQRVVNGLWAAGAEAVAVNGRRLTATSAIRTAGEAILVDFVPLLPPYTVEAVGAPGTLAHRFADGPDARALATLAQAYGIRFDLSAVDSLRLPAAAGSGVDRLRYSDATDGG